MGMKLWRRSLAVLSGMALMGSLLTAALPLATSAENSLWQTSGGLTVSPEGTLTADAAGTAVYAEKIDWVQQSDTVQDYEGGLTFTFDESYWSDPQWFDLHISVAAIAEGSFTVQEDGHRYLTNGDTYFLRPYVEEGVVKIENKLFRSGVQQYATTTTLEGFVTDKPIAFALKETGWRSLVAVQDQTMVALNGAASGIGTGTDYAAVSVAGAFSGVTVTAPAVPEWELQEATVTGTAGDGFAIQAAGAFAARYNTRMDLRDGVDFQIDSQSSWIMIGFGESKDAMSFGSFTNPVAGKISKTVMLRNQGGKVHVSLWNGSTEVTSGSTDIDASASHNLKMVLDEDNHYRFYLDGQQILAADATPVETFQTLNGYDAGTDAWQGGYVQFSSDNAASLSGVKSATEVPEEPTVDENWTALDASVTGSLTDGYTIQGGGEFAARYNQRIDLEKGISFQIDSQNSWVMIGFGESEDAMAFGPLTSPVDGKISRTAMLRNQNGKVHVSLWTGTGELIPELTAIDAAGTHTLKMVQGNDNRYRFCLDGQTILGGDSIPVEYFQTLNGYDTESGAYQGGYVQFSSDGAATISGVKPATGDPEEPQPADGWVTSEGVSISQTGVLEAGQAGTAWTANRVDTLVASDNENEQDYEGGLSFVFDEDYLSDPQWFNLHISTVPITGNSFVSGNTEAGQVEGEQYLANGWTYRIRVRQADIGITIDCNLYINGTLVLPKTVDIMSFLADQPLTFALKEPGWRSLIVMQGTTMQLLGGEASGVATGNDYVGLSFAGPFTGATVTLEVPETEPADTGWESQGVYIDGSEDDGFRLLSTEPFAARYNTGVDLARGFAFNLEAVGDWFMLGIGESEDALSMGAPISVQEGKAGYAMLMRNMDGKLYVALWNGSGEYAMQTYPTIQGLGSHSVKLMEDEAGNYRIYIDGQMILPGLSIPPEEFNRINRFDETTGTYSGAYVWLAGWNGGATITGFKPFRALDPSETENNSEDWYTESACIINDGEDGSYTLTLDAFSSARFLGQMDMARGFVMQLDLSEGLGGSFGFGLGQREDTLTLDVPPVAAEGSYSAVYRLRVIDENTLEILLPDGTSVQTAVDLTAAHTYSLMQDGQNYRLAIDGEMIEGDTGLDLLTYALVNNGGVGTYLTLFAQDRTTFAAFKPLAVYVDTDEPTDPDDSDDPGDWDPDDPLLPNDPDGEEPAEPGVPDTGVAAAWPAALVLAAASAGVLLRSRRRTGANR